MRSTLFENVERTDAENERFVLQNKHTLLVNLNGEVYAKKGAMIAYQGEMDFAHHGGGAGRMLKKMVTGEDMRLMKVTGRGDLFCAEYGADVHIVHFENESLTVSGSSILAFESSIAWDINRVRGGVAAMAAGGLFNVTLTGTGAVALTSWGTPVTIPVTEPTFVDTDCALAWSSSLQVDIKSSMKAGALIGRGSGEAVQMVLSGQGFVVVQPGEGLGALVAGAATA